MSFLTPMEINLKTPNTPKPFIQVFKEYADNIKRYSYGSQKEYDCFEKAISKDNDLASLPVKRFVGCGSSAIVFETADGNILKLTQTSHFPQGRPHESFDVPIIKQGRIGNIRYYIEEFLYQHGLSDGFVLQMQDMIKNKGYKYYDLNSSDTHQIGLSQNGKLYLLDPECARFKTPIHALLFKIKKLLRLR